MSDEPDLPGGAGEQRELLARLRAVVEAKDSENAVLRVELSAALDRERRLELRIAELERRLGMDSSNSGTPGSKEPIGAKERRKAGRRDRNTSERERRKDRKRGGQPGHPGAGLSRDRDPDERKTADPPAGCSGCGASLAGVSAAGSSWAQVWDVKIARRVTEWVLPSLPCRCCGKLTTADAPPGAHPGTISSGAGINATAVLLSGYGNVPSERAARLIAMLLGMPVSPGFVDRASARLDDKLQAAAFDDAMQAALADEPVLGADETPVNVLTRDTDPETGEPEEGAPHVLIVRLLCGVDLEDVSDADLGDVLAAESPAGRGLAGLGGAWGVAGGAQDVAVTSVIAARAADWSAMACPAAQAAIRDATQRLLTVRGRPRLVSWMRVIASSEIRVSLPRPARARWCLM